MADKLFRLLAESIGHLERISVAQTSETVRAKRLFDVESGNVVSVTGMRAALRRPAAATVARPHVNHLQLLTHVIVPDEICIRQLCTAV